MMGNGHVSLTTWVSLYSKLDFELRSCACTTFVCSKFDRWSKDGIFFNHNHGADGFIAVEAVVLAIKRMSSY